MENIINKKAKIILCSNTNCFAYKDCLRTMEEHSGACEGFKKTYAVNPQKAIRVQRATYDELIDLLREKLMKGS